MECKNHKIILRVKFSFGFSFCSNSVFRTFIYFLLIECDFSLTAHKMWGFYLIFHFLSKSVFHSFIFFLEIPFYFSLFTLPISAFWHDRKCIEISWFYWTVFLFVVNEGKFIYWYINHFIWSVNEGLNFSLDKLWNTLVL